jgi:FMN phosphatase YigB (HAD superfamily)
MTRILFDLDNTLTDSEGLREAGIKAGFEHLKRHSKKYGVDIRDYHLKQAKEIVYVRYPDSGMRTCKRRRFSEVVKAAAYDSDIDYAPLKDAMIAEIDAAFRIYQGYLEQARLYASARETIEHLETIGHLWWIFSNATSEDVEVKLKAAKVPEIAGYMAAYSTDTIKSPGGLVAGIGMNKTPEAYAYFRGSLGIGIMVGNDMENDIKAAQEAGLKAIFCQDGDYSGLAHELSLE